MTIAKVKTVFEKFLKKFFSDSSIHCFPYVVKRDFHFVERIFWLSTLIFSTYCGWEVFSKQLLRYRESPTYLSIEIVSKAEFKLPSFTICTNFTNNATGRKLVKELWNVDESSPNFKLYFDFVQVIANIKHDNFINLKRFANHPVLNKTTKFTMIAFEMKKNALKPGQAFSPVITELGICQSSSAYKYLQYPIFPEFNKINATIETSSCNSVKSCKTNISPSNPNASNIIFVQKHDDVMSADDRDYELLNGADSVEIFLKIDEIISDSDVRNIKAKSRKCLFSNEPQKYFNVYSKNLCKLSCRIDQAKSKCGCVPFLYAIKEAKICSIEGMICLSRVNWYDTHNCNCPSLCETAFLTRISKAENSFHGSFDSTMSVDVTFPKIRIRRSVLFSFTDLIVAFGGSVSFFLGFSFLTGVEMGYFIIEFFYEILYHKRE